MATRLRVAIYTFPHPGKLAILPLHGRELLGTGVDRQPKMGTACQQDDGAIVSQHQTGAYVDSLGGYEEVVSALWLHEKGHSHHHDSRKWPMLAGHIE